MKRFVEGDDRAQSILFPESLDDYIADDNPVRVVDVFVEELDLKALGFDGVEPEAREDEEALRGTFALVGLLLGGVATYGLIELYAPDWPKLIRFVAVLAGACSSAVVFASLAVALRMMFVIAIAMGVLGGIGYLLWKVL